MLQVRIENLTARAFQIARPKFRRCIMQFTQFGKLLIDLLAKFSQAECKLKYLSHE